MDNLITAVIAAGILAAVALMSANYSGQAISNWQAKSDATKIVADAKLIADAWREYARANNGSPLLNSYNWSSTSSDLVPSYLSRLPKPPTGAASTSVAYYFPAKVKSYSFNSGCSQTGSAPADSIMLLLRSAPACVALVKMGGYAAPNVKTTTLNGDLTAVSSRRPYDCIYVDSDSSGAPSQGDSMLFVYRIFDQNNFSTTTPTC